MRIYADCYETFSEIFRDLWEMGIIVKPKSYQNKVVEGDENFHTKEIQHYVYTLLSLKREEVLFMLEPTVKEWADAEFEERVEVLPSDPNPGKAWLKRKKVWDQFRNDMGKFDYTYNERINANANLMRVKHELQRNPDTRQAWLPIFDPKDPTYLGGHRRIPCSLGYYFMVREGRLHLTYIQRSADAVVHLGNDIYLAWKMMEHVAKETGYEVGYLTHHIFSLHTYQKDWKILQNGISELFGEKAE
jgi:thymidylate synthase